MILKNVEKKEHNSAVFTVASDAAEFEKAVNGAYLRNKKDVYIPGFRKGKAPTGNRGHVWKGSLLSGCQG